MLKKPPSNSEVTGGASPRQSIMLPSEGEPTSPVVVLTCARNTRMSLFFPASLVPQVLPASHAVLVERLALLIPKTDGSKGLAGSSGGGGTSMLMFLKPACTPTR